MELIDTHSHLYLDQFKEDLQEVIDHCKANEVSRVYLPNIDSSTIEDMLALQKAYPNFFFPMIGLHPCSVKQDYQQELEIVNNNAQKGGFSAIGETGIDLYWDKSLFEEQKLVFYQQVRLAKSLNLPIVIHVRNAFDEIFEMMDELNDENLTGIFHCFTGDVDQAKHILNYGGFKLGIGGVVTFKNSGLDKTLEEIPLENLVVETDSPYLAPSPHRGKRNESAYVRLVAEKLSDIYNVPLEEVARITTANALKIFEMN